MNAEQREIFEETLAADQADLEAQLAALQGNSTVSRSAPDKQQRRQPKREALPPHLPRVDQRIEPEDTRCPTPECGRPMVRVGEDISERLDIVPAQFRVQRQIRGKWACKCWPTRWSAASSITFPTIGRSRSTRARGCTRRARRWRPGAGTPGVS
jgi:hypothetical protein